MIRFALLVAIVCSPLVALAAEESKTPKGYTGEVQKVIENALKQYRAARTYQDQYVSEIKIDATGAVPPTPPAQKQTLAYEKPNKLALRSDDYSIVSDGKTLREWVPTVEQYVETAAPAKLDLEHMALSEFPAFIESRHPLALVLTSGDASLTTLFGEVVEYKGVTPEKRGEITGRRISGVTTVELGSGSVEVPFTAWFNPAGLLEEVSQDLTRPLLDKIGGEDARLPFQVKSYRQVKRFVKPVLDGELPKNAFEFKPGQFDRKLTAFEATSPEEMQQRMIGRPAPNFETTDLQGRKVSLSDYKGKVVLLDFWATWCGPCVMSMPGIQKIADDFAKKPVVVLGISGDDIPPATQPSDTPEKRFAKIVAFLKDKKITYPQAFDENGVVSSKYRVSGIPCVFLIDRKGLVQAVHNGYIPDAAEAFGRQIDLLLAGKKLPVESQPAE